VAVEAQGELPGIYLDAWGGVDAATLVAALGAGRPPPLLQERSKREVDALGRYNHFSWVF